MLFNIIFYSSKNFNVFQFALPSNSMLPNQSKMQKSGQNKGQVHCFSMQVVMNKCFLLNPEKKFGPDPSFRFWEKCKNVHL